MAACGDCLKIYVLTRHWRSPHVAFDCSFFYVSLYKCRFENNKKVVKFWRRDVIVGWRFGHTNETGAFKMSLIEMFSDNKSFALSIYFINDVQILSCGCDLSNIMRPDLIKFENKSGRDKNVLVDLVLSFDLGLFAVTFFCDKE